MDRQHLQEHIRTLATLEQTDAPLLSCYLDIESGQKRIRDFLHERMVGLRKTHKGKAYDQLQSSISRVDRFLEREVNDDARGVALFHRSGDHPFDLALQFKVPVPNWLSVDSRPHIFHLVELKDSYDRFIIMLSTQESGRIMEVSLGSITKELWTNIPELSGDIRHKWVKEHYQNHRKERSNRFFKEKVRILEDLMRKEGHSYLILAGNPTITAQIRKLLPKSLEEKLVDIVSASGREKVSKVVAAALSAFIDHEQRESQAMVDTLVQELNTAGLAVAGTAETLAAIGQGNVDVLILDRDYDPGPGHRCGNCRTILAGNENSQSCPYCKNEDLQECDLKQEIMATVQQEGCHVEVVSGSESLTALGGIGCLLRYRMPEY